MTLVINPRLKQQVETAGTSAFPEECCDALLNLVRHDRDRRVLIAAVSALGHLRNRRCEPDLIALKNHSEEEIRHGVAFALRGTNEPASVQALLELMEDPNERARDWATTSIGQTVSVDGAEIRAALLRRANDSDVLTRAEALHGLARRRDERVVPYLIANLPLERYGTYPFYDAAMTLLSTHRSISAWSNALPTPRPTWPGPI